MTRRRRICDVAVLVALAAGFLLSVVGPALAHVDFVSSTPADGDVLTEPLERIELVFTEPAEPVPGQIQLTNESRPVDISVFPSNDTVVVEPGEPLADGTYALIWTVESAADGHRIEGTVSFTVNLSGAETPEGDPAPAGATTTLPMVSERLPAAAFETAATATAPQDESAGKWIARLGRWAMMAGGLLAIGAFVFAGTALSGSEAEVRQAVRWMRSGGILVITGTLVEVVGAALMRAGSLGDALSRATLVDLLAGSFGVAVLLRLAGGIALLQDPRLATTIAVGSSPPTPADVPPADQATSEGGAAVITKRQTQRFRLDLGRETVALVGVLAVAASFMFDGHSASADASLIARGASFVHVLAAGVWFGGLVVMAATLTRRRRRGTALEGTPMAIRFSRAAAAALTIAAAAGIALTWTILDSPSELLSGTWGRLLVAKVVLVVAVATAGGYNHFRVVPALAEDPTNPATSERLRKVVTLEAELLIIVVAITAVLVGAAP